LAEGEGFEPPVPFRVQWFSRPPPSTTRPSLRVENSARICAFPISRARNSAACVTASVTFGTTRHTARHKMSPLCRGGRSSSVTRLADVSLHARPRNARAAAIAALSHAGIERRCGSGRTAACHHHAGSAFGRRDTSTAWRWDSRINSTPNQGRSCRVKCPETLRSSC
jgi:hypothetical protein